MPGPQGPEEALLLHSLWPGRAARHLCDQRSKSTTPTKLQPSLALHTDLLLEPSDTNTSGRPEGQGAKVQHTWPLSGDRAGQRTDPGTEGHSLAVVGSQRHHILISRTCE